MASKKGESVASKSKAALDAYNLVVKECELSDIRLIESDFKIALAYFPTIDEERQKNKNLTKKIFDSKFSDLLQSPESKLLSGVCKWTVIIKKGNKNILKITGSYLLIYSNSPDVPEEHAFAFLRRVCRFAAYPYFRALAANLAADARADLPVLPLLK